MWNEGRWKEKGCKRVKREWVQVGEKRGVREGEKVTALSKKYCKKLPSEKSLLNKLNRCFKRKVSHIGLCSLGQGNLSETSNSANTNTKQTLNNTMYMIR